MQERTSRQLVGEFVAAVWNAGRFDDLDTFVHPLYEVPGVGHGPAAVRENVSAFRTAFPDLDIAVEDLIAEGDRVVARLTLRGTQLGPFRGHAPTGRQATWSEIAIWRVEEGRLREGWFVADALGLRQQLGLPVT